MSAAVSKDWKVSRAFKYVGSGTTPKSGDPDYYNEGTINWLITGDLNDTEITNITKKITPKAVADYPTLKLYPAGSLVVAMYGATIGKVGILLEASTVNQACCVLVADNKILPHYALYYFLASKQKLIDRGVGGGQPNISQDIIKSFRINLPDLETQRKITKYINAKTASIDKTITTKKDLQKKLLELRRSTISAYVLGRMNSSARKKTSISWINSIPEHWYTKKIKHIATVKARIGWQSLTTDEYLDEGPFLVTGTDFRDGVVDWTAAAHVSDGRWAIDSNIQLEENDLLLTKDGTIGKVAVVKNLEGKATLNSGVFVIRAKNSNYNPRYLYHVLNSSVFTEFIDYMKTGSTINHLYQQTFIEFSFPLPLREEQDDIVINIDTQTNKIDKMLMQVNRSIKLFHEYRSSLISNVIAGKVKI